MKKTSTQFFKKIILVLFICANYSLVSQVAAYISPTGTLITGPIPGPVSSGTLCAGVYTYTNASTAAVNYTWFATPATSVTISNAFAVSPTFTFNVTGPTNFTITLIASSGTTAATSTGQVIKVIGKPNPILSASSPSICSGSATTLSVSPAQLNYLWSNAATTQTTSVAPLVTSLYSFTTTIGGITGFPLCVSMNTININVTATPTLAIAGPTTSCSGQVVTLTASGASTYSWNTGAITPFVVVSPTTTTNYTVTGSNGTCSSTKTVSLVVSALPTAANAGVSQTVCATGATLNGNTPLVGVGSWSLVSGAGAITSPTVPGSAVTGLGVGTNVFQWTITNGVCSSTSTMSVKRDVNPSISVAGASQTVCANTATLAANTPSVGTGAWSIVSGSGVITSSTSPSTGLTGLGLGNNVWQWQISNGVCPASTSTVSVFASSPPFILAFSSSSLICAGQTAVLSSSSSATSYTWSTGSNSTSISVSPTVTTTYTLIGTNAAGCVATTTVIQNVSACTGIAEANTANNSVAVYPNPTNGELTISLQNTENAFVEVYNGIGQLIAKEMVNENEFKIDLKEQPVGIYHLRLTKGAEQIYKTKVVKN